MTDQSRPRGTGPGVITPDGCAVDFYARITAIGEPEIVRDAAGPGAWILELGCGAGRAPDLISATVEYVDGEQVWTQTFTARRLDDTELAAVLADAGLRLDRYLTDDRTWLRAVPEGAVPEG
jgi:hypothetical protein